MLCLGCLKFIEKEVKNMKRISNMMIIYLLIVFATTTAAFAGGWHTIGANHDPDAGLWGAAGNVPHQDLPTANNKCRTCHAIHNADPGSLSDSADINAQNQLFGGTAGLTSFKLLRNNSRPNECMYCHAATTGKTSLQPYGNIPNSEVLGEHTLGKKVIPSSTITSGNSILTDGLSCGNCHSVHNSFALFDYLVDNDGSGPGDPQAGALKKLLRRDPGNNGGDVLTGITQVADPDGAGPGKAAEGATSSSPLPNLKSDDEVLASFCGDCHNKNVNWDRGYQGTPAAAAGQSAIDAGGANREGERPNSMAHPLGNGIDGLVDVYGTLQNVEQPAASWKLAKSCTSCHRSKAVSGAVSTLDKFPHQSRSHKFLTKYDGTTYTAYNQALDPDDPTDDGDPNRVLPALGEWCYQCHSNIGDFNSPSSF